jgi:Mg-chelatase subunit ChlD
MKRFGEQFLKENAMFKIPYATACGGTALLAVLILAGFGISQEPVQKAKPRVEVVFVLDTTGSMGGLINAAKQKIWSISNQIAGGQPTPELKVGLIAYRDRGDAYVTKIFDLTDDLDAIHGHLMSFKAQGGGDFPESVNQALNEAVTKIDWSKDKGVLKMIFLVGDAPPKHYADDVPYEQTCQLAVKSDIIINTVQCGNHAETEKHWRKICQLAEGSYVQISADGGPVVVVKTPFDEELFKINNELTRNTLTYGKAEMQAAGEAKKDASLKLAPGAAAERAAFQSKNKIAASYDLIDGINKGTVKLRELKKEELPKELQGLTEEQQKAYLQKVEKERTVLQQKAIELDKKRQAFIAEELKNQSKADPSKNSFDQQVLQILQNQAQRVNIQYGTPQEKKK